MVDHCAGAACAIVETGKDHYRTEIHADGHVIISDEPVELGGKNEGINPTLLLLASLGSCTSITLRMYADRKNWPIDKIRVELYLDVVKSELQQTTFIKRHIHFEGDITEEQKSRLLDIADKCPLHKVMTNPIVISTNILD
ncbi:OsmC family protein [Daejeonella oryzae]|uniref:OsmC family protein n=1 Tax=Daejeonella oryzae TaxID=1122943 RepID=UPI000407008F|nr:OsmC family protein [Daejeonella oryzae]